MNRRTFLKSIVTVCGTAVVCPGELLKGGSKPGWYDFKVPIDKSVKWKAYYNGGYFKSEAEYEEFLKKFRAAFKNTKFKPPVTYQGCTDSIIIYGIPYYFREIPA